MIGKKETNEDNIQKINQDNIYDYNTSSTYIVVSKSPCVLPHLKRCGLFGTHQSSMNFECHQESDLKRFLRFGCSRFYSTLKCGVLVKNLDITNYK